jgi:hypothetical protein
VGAVAGGEETRRRVTVADAEFAARTVTIGVDGGFRHAELPGDLLRGQMLIDQPQTFPFPRCQEFDIRVGHGANTRIRRTVNALPASASTLAYRAML